MNIIVLQRYYKTTALKRINEKYINEKSSFSKITILYPDFQFNTNNHLKNSVLSLLKGENYYQSSIIILFHHLKLSKVHSFSKATPREPEILENVRTFTEK